jgi:hypothetical protein
MAGVIATVGTVEVDMFIKRRGMHRHVTLCASAFPAVRDITTGIGATAAATVIRAGMDIPMATGTVAGTNTVP